MWKNGFYCRLFAFSWHLLVFSNTFRIFTASVTQIGCNQAAYGNACYLVDVPAPSFYVCWLCEYTDNEYMSKMVQRTPPRTITRAARPAVLFYSCKRRRKYFYRWLWNTTCNAIRCVSACPSALPLLPTPRQSNAQDVGLFARRLSRFPNLKAIFSKNLHLRLFSTQFVEEINISNVLRFKPLARF